MDMTSVYGKFITSAIDIDGLPADDRAEIAVLGRSNAGKSSFINSLLQRKVAFVSKTPGKTQLLNFFDFGPNSRLVDFPGYGFAKVGDKLKDQWTDTIESYLSIRANLVGALLLVDIRRDWSDDEKNLISFLESRSIPVLILATKVDKMSRTQIEKQINIWRKSGLSSETACVSSHAGTGIEELRKKISSQWVGKWQKQLQ